MALASVTYENQALDSLTLGATNVGAYVSLHTGTPGQTGASEVSGGGYTRVAVTWAAASGGSKLNNGSTMTFSTAGATPVTYFGTWSAVTAGSYGIGGALGSPVTATSITIAAGAITLTAS